MSRRANLLVLVVAVVCLAVAMSTTIAVRIPINSHPTTTRWHQLSKDYTFERWAKEFNKHYSTQEEYLFRKDIFEKKLETILAHNSNPHSTYKMGVNHLTAHTEEEFRRLLGYKPTPNAPSKHRLEAPEHLLKPNFAAPPYIDWRDFGVISSVKDQGQCGSCWTFGTAETVESHYALSTFQLTDLSEQQILDCTPNPNACGGTGGCQGGTAEIAYEQIIELGGLASEWTYPYQSYHGNDFPTCRFNATTTPAYANFSSYIVLPSNQYWPVFNALQEGPLAINVDASAWSNYETGIFTGCNASNVDIDHVVQLVGYGTDHEAGDYWLVRNSWSPAWGELGYIRLPRSENPSCGNDTQPQDGTGCNGGPSVVEVCGSCGILYDVSYPVIQRN